MIPAARSPKAASRDGRVTASAANGGLVPARFVPVVPATDPVPRSWTWGLSTLRTGAPVVDAGAVDEEISRGCYVEGCEASASERAPGVFFCERHWEALCDAYARQRTHRPAQAPPSGPSAPAAPAPRVPAHPVSAR